MSDVIVSTVESTTNVTTSNDVTTIAVTETTVDISASTAGVQGASYNQGDPIYVTVRNATGSTLAKGTIVYTSGANGVHTQVSKAIATGDSTSARTLGWLAEDIVNNASGLCMVEGYLDGVNTQGITEGSQLYLSGTTAGGFTATKPQAPIHLVYVGVCSKASAGNGRVYVKVQNGYELDELHDVQITSPANNDVLTYETATGLWKNKVNAADGVTSVVFSAPLTGGTVTSAGTVGIDQTLLSLTKSQISDFTSGTVTNISGTVTQTQVSNLTTDLASKAALGSANTFTLGQTIQTGAAANKGLVVQGATSQSADLLQIQNSGATVIAKIGSTGDLTAGYGYLSGLRDVAATGPYVNLTSTQVLLNSRSATNKGLVIQGAASQSADYFQIQDSTGSTALWVNSIGSLLWGGLSGSFLSGTSGRIFATTNSTSVVPITVRGIASQSANLQEWQNSAGGTVAAIDSSGQVMAYNALRTTAITNTVTFNNSRIQIANGGVLVDTGIFNNPALRIQNTNSTATANLTEWQSSTGGTVARVASDGSFYSSTFFTTNAYSALGENTGGGSLRLTRATATMTNPGANLARLYFRTGTNANTLKLVVIAGATGAETTILDNIPT